VARDREELVERLRKGGCADADIDAAEAAGRLASFAVDRALGGEERYTLTDLAGEAGQSTAFIREFMQAIGRPNARRGERAYTDDDLEALRLIRRFVDAGLPRRDVLEVGRVLSQCMSQGAEAVRRLAGDALLKAGDTEYTVGLRYAMAADELAPLMPRLLDYHFRAHLRDGIRRQMITEAERQAGKLDGTSEVAVAFADLVDYTRLGEQLPPEDVGRIAARFAQLAVKTVERPVRLIKTIGDAALFVSDDVPQLLDTLTRLVEEVDAEGEAFPDVRVGVAYGPATTTAGDWFGGTVNLASRVTGVAKPGRILATADVEERADGYEFKRARRRRLKGVDGWVRLFALDPVS
jgi:adenylate cyclase